MNKLALLAVGIIFSFFTIEATSTRLAQAQKICQSYRITRPEGLNVYVVYVRSHRRVTRPGVVDVHIQGRNQIITTLPYNYIVTVTQISRNRKWAKIQYLKTDGLRGEGWVSPKSLACFQR